MSARVLVVDDVDVNVKLLEAKLAAEYFDVITASNGIAALKLAQEEQPDLLLLDVMMPQMDGFETCRRLKADPRTADIPVVMVTALSDASDRLRGLEAGADDFLTKPVNDIALFARVRSLVRLKRTMDEWRLREEVCDRFASLPGEQRPGTEELAGARFLVVEDSRLAAAKICDSLSSLAAESKVVATVREALAALDEPYDLIIIGMAIGNGDPLRLVSHLRANEATRQVPILLVADEAELPRLAKGLDLGANDYILRPVDRNELLARGRTQLRRKRLNDRLRENYQKSLSLALTDPLTQLYNRRYVSAHLESLIGREAEAGKSGVAVLMFDIDRFKQINDGHGHAVGDEVLVEVARRAQHCVRSFDLVARYGGEEFLVVMPETSFTIALTVAERLRAAIADGPVLASSTGARVPVTISIGVAVAEGPADTPAGILRRADEALYSAKNSGRNRVAANGHEPVEITEQLLRAVG
jgi:two-component system cell cycle response regulator